MNQYEADALSTTDLIDALNAMPPDLDSAISALMSALRRISLLETQLDELTADQAWTIAADAEGGGL